MMDETREIIEGGGEPIQLGLPPLKFAQKLINGTSEVV
jgi:hypothetical protein